jgi:hypothetical protein
MKLMQLLAAETIGLEPTSVLHEMTLTDVSDCCASFPTLALYSGGMAPQQYIGALSVISHKQLADTGTPNFWLHGGCDPNLLDELCPSVTCCAPYT